MKQLMQNMRDGRTVVAEVPCPSPRPGTLLVRTAASLVSAGTERMVVEFAEKNLVEKARSRPDLVRQVLDKARREGLIPTIQAAFNRLDQPMALGYSSAGTVVAAGKGMETFQAGDRVACAGGNYAVHAEYAVVPRNLVAKLPDGVDFESAAFTTLGAIAMHGFRLAQPQLGERVAIIGMGLLGLLAAGIARAAGCSVFGIDLSPQRVQLARQMGFEAVTRGQAEETGKALSRGQGFDVVLICADSRSNDPIELAGTLARDRGRVIAIGAVGLAVPRKVYYEKELFFQVSRSYGPGRYDLKYEDQGQDYPAGFVRWTEGRNLESFVDLLASGKVDVHPLISHHYPIDRATEAYALITGKLNEPFLGVLLTYPHAEAQEKPSARIELARAGEKTLPTYGALALGVLGAGNYATAVFLPTISKVGGIRKAAVATASGLSARHAAQRFGFEAACSSEDEVLGSPDVNVVAILTRHNQHARQALAALRAGKHVYCEKPLAINATELDEIETALAEESLPLLMTGFNRRFAPFAARMRAFLESGEPFAAHYRINAGAIPLNHWTQDPAQGGGRIIGESCHFVDFLTFLAGAAPISVNAQALPDNGQYCRDNALITLGFPDGSLGTIAYLANGDKSFSKERVEVFRGGRVAVLDDFRRLEMVNNGRRKVLQSRLGQDKGHRGSWSAFLEAVHRGGPAPIPYDQMIGVTRATFAILQSLADGRKIDLPR